MLETLTETAVARTEYGGWPNCYRLTNGVIELVATADVGPRIIRFGFIGGQNLFAEFTDQFGKTGEPYWMPRGGHRLWTAPEIKPDTYALDNSPLQVSAKGRAITLLQPVEPETGLQKEISIAIEGETGVTVSHRITNRGPKSRRFAPWAVTQMARGGVGIAAFPRCSCQSNQLRPTNPLVMWSYTNFSDPRWLLTNKYLILQQDSSEHSPQKAGLFNPNTLLVYVLGTELFVKRTQALAEFCYPDFQCSCEMFVNGDFLELETLGPLAEVPRDGSVTHIERWSLHRNICLTEFSDEAIENVLIEPDLASIVPLQRDPLTH